ncbi:uncharacterized protein N7459_008272 [Penicillium hispanicum]|uniref:uncharacterized protein n=1 Tax=Penicillium hispanicum TaxID=1080232 RepID=UPI0025419050|nr:uncharacterized protein N7459_008272 [Penicillium hispanicum]KAJ5573845.1 hypothetical protein N7459_008272 [Penicillium hispanicum]
METQDSIDIAELQRVALGLEHEPSQSFPSGLAKIDSAPQNDPSRPNHHAVHRSHGDASATNQGLSSTPSSHPTSSTLQERPRPSRRRQYERTPMNPSSDSIEPNKVNPVSRPQRANMDSVEAPPSDTQVVSQSVYDSIIRQNGESMHGGPSQNGADEATLRTLHEGDSGHIDLLAEFDSAPANTTLSQDNDLESTYDQSESSPMAYQPEFFPESQRFLTTTPGTAVKMNQTPGTSTETPSLSRNPLAGDIESSGGLLGLSQVFKATQAPSSPLVHGQQPEIMSDRPSPNIQIQQPRIANAVSSPLANLPVNFTRESSEPNLNYISMRESQSRRDKSLGERPTRSADNMPSEDQIDEEFYKESSFVENARRERQINEETAVHFAALNAPSRSRPGTATSPEHLAREPQDQTMTGPAESEEETEQEEDFGPQVPQSQDIPQSSEEDKENYNGPPAAVGPSSAHDRLSQALALEGSPSSQIESRADDHTERDQYSGRSSQVMVKDSQQSPQLSPKPIDKHDRASPQLQVPPLEPVSDVEVDNTSPVRRSVRSSPPYARPAVRPGSCVDDHSRRGDSHQPEPFQKASSSDNRQTHSSNPSELPRPASLSNQSQSGFVKSSSMPSRVTETPVHRRPTVGDMSRLTSIPETSPNRTQTNGWEAESNGDGMNNEDDDLPPMLPTVNAYWLSQARPIQSRALSSPIKNLQSQAQSQILSSPSGRQRRALTEIASDCSPQVDFKIGDLGMDFFTADDEQFNSLVQDGSPTRAKKRRRGNQGQSFHTSDTAIPATPRFQPPKTVAPVQRGPSPEMAQTPVAIHVPETTVRRQAESSRRAENVWEIGSSPQQRVIRRGSRVGRVTSSRPLEDQRAQKNPTQHTQNRASAVRPVVVHNPRPPPSSELTDIDIGSEDLQSDTNTANSLPTTPPPRLVSDDRQVAPSQVLAIWMGQKRAYYPATCFGTPLGVSQTKYSVKFEDSLPVEVVKGAVKRLELRIGDGVKVDMREVPKVTHIVRGFDDKLTREELARAADSGVYPQTDIYGHTTVILGPKQRKSLPNGGLGHSENVIKVPISRIYLDSILWNQLKDRAFTYQPESAPQEAAPHTPSEKSSLPASPSTRFSRSLQSASGIFANMAFAVSYKEDDGSKNRVSKLIVDNGGSILHDGFTELFEPSSILPFDTPIKGQTKKDNSSSSGMRLTSLAENVGFTCLIADTHSRREKYMQALALGLPCLSGRWIEDCVAKGRVLDWDVYLLPAGDSMYLNGATKSRVLVPSSPSDTRLTDTISARPKLLAGQSVLIVTGRGKAEEKRKAYIFLTFALGASRVERVADLETAKAMMISQSDAGLSSSWDLIYVDDADQASAKALLTPQPKTQRIHLFHGRKRKKSTVFTMSNPDTQHPPTARVVGNEFVCQSLILGRLFEE